jgi:Ca2+-binding RTX toxin-like protein
MSAEHFHPLEDRRMMSVSLDPASGALRIEGTDSADVITVQQGRGLVTVTDNGAATTFNKSDVKSISISAKGGNDSVTMTTSIFASAKGADISGGSGRDTLAGSRGPDTISGNGGDDVIRGGGGNDYLYGDTSKLMESIAKKRSTDLVTRTSAISKGLFDVAPRAGTTSMLSSSIIGGLIGKPKLDLTDIISKPIGIGGVVTKLPPFLYTETDFDQILGGSGNDYIYSGAGNDTCSGEMGADTIYGGADSDQLFGNEDADRLYGEDGVDTLEGGAASDYVEGGAGIDKILSNDGDLIQIGSRQVYGDIGIKYVALGGEGGFLGLPLNSETGTPDGVGRYNHFQGGSIYWTPATGAQVVYGAIRDMWADLGWEKSCLGYPTSDELQDGGERVSHFQNGDIAWSGDTGAYIRKINMMVPTDQWQDDNWSCGPNSVSRVLRYYGINVSYGEARNYQRSETDLVSRFGMGSRPSQLLETFRHWKADSYRESRTNFDRVLQVLSEGKPVVALIGKGRDYTFGLGSVPKTLHWIVLTGFDKKTNTIFYTDTKPDKNGAIQKQYTYDQFNQVWNWYSSGAKGGFVTGTMDVPERTILY